jgi:hypothetical protein
LSRERLEDAHDTGHLERTGLRDDEVLGDGGAALDAVKIQRRAGHTTIQTTMGYIREAETFEGDAFGVPFPPLPLERLGANPSTEVVTGSPGRWTGSFGGEDGIRTRV